MRLIQQTSLGFEKKGNHLGFKIILILVEKLILMSMSKCMLEFLDEGMKSARCKIQLALFKWILAPFQKSPTPRFKPILLI